MLVLETGSRILYELFYVYGCLTMKRNCLPLANTWGDHLGEHMGWPSWPAHGMTILAITWGDHLGEHMGVIILTSTWGDHLGEHMRWPSVYMGFMLLIVLFFCIVFFVLFIFVLCLVFNVACVSGLSILVTLTLRRWC